VGYSKSKKAIRRVELYLQQLVIAEGKIEFPSDDPATLSYRIREGSTASKGYVSEGEPYLGYAKIVSRFRIHTRTGFVSCELRDELSQPEGLGYVSIPDVSDTLGVIGATIKHRAPLLLFPDANIHTVVYDKLVLWGEKQGYRIDADEESVRVERT